jgi:predicted pyridoxine 5'-phosphate oxidase superfamily flavin-nucleotide-binding protein
VAPAARARTRILTAATRPAGARVEGVKLSPDMQRVVLDQSLGFVATVTPEGRPNLSPKGTTTILDDEHLIFADVASPGTVTHLATNPYVEVNVVDPIARKGYRFKGSATVHRSGDTFDHALQVFRQRGYTTRPERIRALVIIEVTDAAPLLSPAYDDGTTEQAIVDRWLDHHNRLHPSAH